MKNLKKIAFVFAIVMTAFLFGTVENVQAQRNNDRNRGNGSGEMTWSGTVDDTIQVIIRNRNARIRHIKGRAYNDDRFDFNGRMPRRDANLSVDKKDGRGRVFIFQRPSRRNNYTTIVQVEDPKGGADKYRFRLSWN